MHYRKKNERKKYSIKFVYQRNKKYNSRGKVECSPKRRVLQGVNVLETWRTNIYRRTAGKRPS